VVEALTSLLAGVLDAQVRRAQGWMQHHVIFEGPAK
jgi:hypothetical protein